MQIYLVAIPFRVGWDFSLAVVAWRGPGYYGSQSLSGWDGIFHLMWRKREEARLEVAIPFRVGWDFSQQKVLLRELVAIIQSQSLSGWDGIFHRWQMAEEEIVLTVRSQSLSGWDGIFHAKSEEPGSVCRGSCRNPFQGGMGFFTPVSPDRLGCKPAEAFRQPQVCPPKTSKKL